MIFLNRSSVADLIMKSFSVAFSMTLPSKLHESAGSGFPMKSTDNLNDSPTFTFASSGFFVNFGDTCGGDILRLLPFSYWPFKPQFLLATVIANQNHSFNCWCKRCLICFWDSPPGPFNTNNPVVCSIFGISSIVNWSPFWLAFAVLSVTNIPVSAPTPLTVIDTFSPSVHFTSSGNSKNSGGLGGFAAGVTVTSHDSSARRPDSVFSLTI